MEAQQSSEILVEYVANAPNHFNYYIHHDFFVILLEALRETNSDNNSGFDDLLYAADDLKLSPQSQINYNQHLTQTIELNYPNTTIQETYSIKTNAPEISSNDNKAEILVYICNTQTLSFILFLLSLFIC
jgi:hypothetical protein